MSFYQRLKRQVLSRVWLSRGLIILLALVLVASGMWLTRRQWTTKQFTALSNFRDRTNLLVLGVSGGDHEGADLTDSMMVISVETHGKDVVVINIPRDLWVPSLRAKINTAYHYGQLKQPSGGGIILAKSAVSEILGQPVHYAAVVDFSQFEKFIDAIGGIDVEVERDLDDLNYPVSGREDDLCSGDPQFRCRYERLYIKAGKQHFDGATALKFARSRYAVGDEGTDFARAARQQKIVLAIKAKLLSSRIYLHPQKSWELLNTFIRSVETDLTTDQYAAAVRLGLTSAKAPVRTQTLAEPLVYNPPLSKNHDFQWVLLPKNNNPKVIPEFVTQLLYP